MKSPSVALNMHSMGSLLTSLTHGHCLSQHRSCEVDYDELMTSEWMFNGDRWKVIGCCWYWQILMSLSLMRNPSWLMSLCYTTYFPTSQASSSHFETTWV